MAYGPRIRAGVAKYLVVKDDRRDDGTQDTSLGLVFPEPTIVMYTMTSSRRRSLAVGALSACRWLVPHGVLFGA